MLTRYKGVATVLLLILCALVVILLALTVAFLITKYAPPAPASPSADGDTTAADPSAPPGNLPDGILLTETPDAGLAYQDTLIFVGDSRLRTLAASGLLTGGSTTTQVWRTESGLFNLKPGMSRQPIIYPGPGTHTGREISVAEAAALSEPRVLVLTLGADWGLAYLSEADFKACYTEFIESIRKASPKTVVVLQSIFPVGERCTTLGNQQIDAANRWVQAVAAETGCRYLDTQSALRDENGNLRAEYGVSGDGLRLSVEGYTAVLTYIRTHAVH